MLDKACIGCGETKPIEQFSVYRGRAKARCKACMAAKAAAARAADPERAKAIQVRFRNNNREKLRAKDRARSAAKSEATKLARLERANAAKAAVELLCTACNRVLPKSCFTERKSRTRGHASWCKECYRTRRDKAKAVAYAKTYYAANLLAKKAAKRRWIDENPDKHRAQSSRRRAALAGACLVAVTADDIAARFAVYGNRCAYCGVDGPMTLDHVKPIALGGKHMPANIRPACKSCNSSKSGRPLHEWLATRSNAA
jgi:5-methylcytosine-specific restriction endonuclease McrA